MPPDPGLDGIQRWMLAVVAQPEGVEAGVASPAAGAIVAADRVGEVILPSRTLSPLERLEIYQGMYLPRMRDALKTDYPGLAHFLGDDGFLDLVHGYISKHPSKSYTLNRLGDHLPAYIAAAAKLPRLRQRDFLHDLARLELAMTEVFDAESATALTPEAIAAVPEEAWEKARLLPIEAFRLLRLEWPASEYLDAMREGTTAPALRKAERFAAVFRRDYSVRRLDLSRPAHGLLARLVAGEPLGEAVERSLRGGRSTLPVERLFRLFRDWMAAGLFRSVEW